VGIPRSLRDFQARWKSRLLDFSTSRLFHSWARRVFGCAKGSTLGGVTSQPVRPEALGVLGQHRREHAEDNVSKFP